MIGNAYLESKPEASARKRRSSFPGSRLGTHCLRGSCLARATRAAGIVFPSLTLRVTKVECTATKKAGHRQGQIPTTRIGRATRRSRSKRRQDSINLNRPEIKRYPPSVVFDPGIRYSDSWPFRGIQGRRHPTGLEAKVLNLPQFRPNRHLGRRIPPAAQQQARRIGKATISW